MTDYKHFPRIPQSRQRISRKFYFIIFILFFLSAMSLVGKEDMEVAQRMDMIDKQFALDHIKRVVAQQESEEFKYYTERSKP